MDINYPASHILFRRELLSFVMKRNILERVVEHAAVENENRFGKFPRFFIFFFSRYFGVHTKHRRRFQVHRMNEEKLEEHDSRDKNTTKVTQTCIPRNGKVDFFS